MSCEQPYKRVIDSFNNNAIGIFDSGYGGLTVAREVARQLPNENIIYFGDSARCPYGPRDQSEVRLFVRQICSWLTKKDVKAIIIGCNTATAAGLDLAKASFDVPVFGVIEAGAKAAVASTKNNRVGVIATSGTINSGAYMAAIHRINPNISVFSVATPKFVDIVEQGIRFAEEQVDSLTCDTARIFERLEYKNIAVNYLDSLIQDGVDTLVLGCTHFPLLKPLIQSVVGQKVKLISSADEIALDVKEKLGSINLLAAPNNSSVYKFYTTKANVDEFCSFGSYVFNESLDNVSYVDIEELNG